MGDFPFKDPDAARYDGPTLFIRGTKSHYVADDVLPLIGRFFPKFELRDIESGHWVISEKPEPFRQGKLAILEFTLRAEPGSCRRIFARQGLREAAENTGTYGPDKTSKLLPFKVTTMCPLQFS